MSKTSGSSDRPGGRELQQVLARNIQTPAPYLQAFLDHAPQLMYAKDTAGCYTFANRAFGELFGVALDELLGRHVEDVLPAEQAERAGRGDIEALKTGSPFRFCSEHVFHGEVRYYDVVNFPVRDAAGGIIATAGIIQDITEWTKAERQAARESQVNDALREILQEILDPECTIEDLALSVLRHARTLSGAAHGYVAELDPATRMVTAHSYTDMFSEACQMQEAGQRLMFTPNLDGTYPGLWGHCLNHRQAYFTNEPQQHPASNGLPDGHLPLENFLAVPALLEGELVGQIALGNSSRGFTADDLDTVQRLAEVYAVALEKKRRIGEIVDSQRLYAQMFHNNHAIKLLIDPGDGSILDANQAACEFYGYLHGELTSITIYDINQLPRPEVTRRMQQARNSNKIDFTFPHRCADGSVRQMEVHSGRIKHGERELLLSILFDVTEREQAERERERALSELRQTLEHVRTLRGLLPICSVCKKIRDDHGYWQQLEAYIARHSEATFTHGICPACEQKVLDDLKHSQEGHGPGRAGNE